MTTKEKDLVQAKFDLRSLLIERDGEDNYYQVIAEKTKWINDFKLIGDKIFGQDDEMFRYEVRKSILSKDLSDEDMLFEFVITDIALDTILN